jgi:hypothetical protein
MASVAPVTSSAHDDTVSIVASAISAMSDHTGHQVTRERNVVESMPVMTTVDIRSDKATVNTKREDHKKAIIDREKCEAK